MEADKDEWKIRSTNDINSIITLSLIRVLTQTIIHIENIKPHLSNN